MKRLAVDGRPAWTVPIRHCAAVSFDELRRRAAAQGGVFTTADARACGVGRSALRHAVATGRLTVLRRGVLAETSRLCGPASQPRDLLVARAWAAFVAVGRAAAVSHHSAAMVHGLPTYGRVPSWVSLTTARPGTPESLPGLRVRRALLPAGHVGQVDRLPVTTLARTAVDVARAGCMRSAVMTIDGALRAGASRAELEAVHASQRGWAGSRTVARALAVADEGSESPLESLAHVAYAEIGLPRPLTQRYLYDEAGLIGRVDDYWPDLATVGETDGLAKYDEPGALRAEKLRQERIERTGLQVVRVTVDDVTRDLGRTRDRFRAAFHRGRGTAPRVLATRYLLDPWEAREAFATAFARLTEPTAAREPADAGLGSHALGEAGKVEVRRR